MSPLTNKLIETLRCPACQSILSRTEVAFGESADAHLVCKQCSERFPIINGIPRLLLPPLREALLGNGIGTGNDAQQIATALSFGFEWHRFPEMYKEWDQVFLSYVQPHGPEFFLGKRVMDAGCGNGRFAYYAAKYGAEVWALDLSPAVEVARRNTEEIGDVHIIQADLHRPPFALESFDFIYSLGVLHHLPNPEAAFQKLLKFLKPGGEIQIYLYWKPEGQLLKSAMLAAIAAIRRLTTSLPHNAVHALSYPAAVTAFAGFVWPYQVLRRIPGLAELAERMPMKQYARLPFRVCVNDQFDRLSAPIENRYTRQAVKDWFNRAGLEDPKVSANYGWVGTGRKPAAVRQSFAS